MCDTPIARISFCILYLDKNKTHHEYSSCEIDFVEIHLGKLCVILRSRVLLVVCPHQGQIRPATPTGTSLYQGQQGDVNRFVRRQLKIRF